MPDTPSAHSNGLAPTIAAPRPDASPPRLQAPPLACDCHAHVIGPHRRYPLAAERRYTPHETLPQTYRALLDKLGIARGVLVQPSVYLLDNSCLLDAMAASPGRFRGVVAIDSGITQDDLLRMHELGARGARLTLVAANGVSLEDVRAIAGRIGELGWHLQVSVSAADIETHAERLRAVPIPLVFDHLGRPLAREGLHGRAFQTLLKLMDCGKNWVKLSAPMRCSEQEFPYADVTPFVRELVRLFPERLVWGSDWPHTTIDKAMPDDGALLDLLLDWMPDRATRNRVLAENAALLYDF